MGQRHVRDSIREVDDQSWLIGDTLLLSRTTSSNGAWADGNGRGYQLTEAPAPLPPSRPLSDTSEIKLVYDAGDASAVFRIGEAFCKVRLLTIPEVTREHTTYAWLHQRSWSFSIPKVIHHTEHQGRYYIFLTRVPGMTIDSLWPTLDETTKQRYVERVVDICKELNAAASGTSIGGVEGGIISELYLSAADGDCSPQTLHKTSLELGMDCSRLVFYHCDMGPTNVLFDPVDHSAGVIDWEVAGFVPLEWVRTKFRVSVGFDLCGGDALDYRRRVQICLGEAGFTDVSSTFMDIRNKKSLAREQK